MSLPNVDLNAFADDQNGYDRSFCAWSRAQNKLVTFLRKVRLIVKGVEVPPYAHAIAT